MALVLQISQFFFPPQFVSWIFPYRLAVSNIPSRFSFWLIFYEHQSIFPLLYPLYFRRRNDLQNVQLYTWQFRQAFWTRQLFSWFQQSSFVYLFNFYSHKTNEHIILINHLPSQCPVLSMQTHIYLLTSIKLHIQIEPLNLSVLKLVALNKWAICENEDKIAVKLLAERKDILIYVKNRESYASCWEARFFFWVSLSLQKSPKKSFQPLPYIKKLRGSPSLYSAWSHLPGSVTCTSNIQWTKAKRRRKSFKSSNIRIKKKVKKVKADTKPSCTKCSRKYRYDVWRYSGPTVT